MKDYKLVEAYGFKRVTRYEKYVNEIKSSNRQKRIEKLNDLKKLFDAEKTLFFNERDKALHDIEKELEQLGFNDIKLPKISKNGA